VVNTIAQQPPVTAVPPRTLHDICEAARLVPCGYCWGDRGEHCALTGTRAHPVEGWHLLRFCRARRKGLISEADMAAVLDAAGDVFTADTVIWDVPRLRASCTCGWTWEGPERAWEWIEDRHCHAHQKGIDGLSACGSITVERDGAR
jgi:hypothetical protein